MTSIDPKKWTRETLEKHSVDMRQFIDFRESTLPNGMRIIEAYNSSGLTFTILPDRGMDIWTAHYKGIPLSWISQGSPHPPDWGQSWLRQFNGGLLTTCGLTHVGPPEVDDITGEQRDIHGNFTRLRAYDVSKKEETNTLQITGTLTESRLFGTQLKVHRHYEIQLGIPRITLRDEIINLGDTPAPFMILYHINFGFPLIRAGTKFVSASKVFARDEDAKAGLDTWDSYDEPMVGYAEQVFFHHLTVPQNEVTTETLIHNGEIGLIVGEQHTEHLPYLTQWKNTRYGIYVCSIEPGNCIPEGQNAARQNGRLQMLQPGERRSLGWSISIIESAEAIQQKAALIEARKAQGILSPYQKLDDYVQS
jgi:hypothetical protein